MLKAVQNVLPTKMECSALQNDGLHSGVLGDGGTHMISNELIYADECQDVQSKQEPVQYVYSDVPQSGILISQNCELYPKIENEKSLYQAAPTSMEVPQDMVVGDALQYTVVPQTVQSVDVPRCTEQLQSEEIPQTNGVSSRMTEEKLVTGILEKNESNSDMPVLQDAGSDTDDSQSEIPVLVPEDTNEVYGAESDNSQSDIPPVLVPECTENTFESQSSVSIRQCIEVSNATKTNNLLSGIIIPQHAKTNALQSDISEPQYRESNDLVKHLEVDNESGQCVPNEGSYECVKTRNATQVETGSEPIITSENYLQNENSLKDARLDSMSYVQSGSKAQEIRNHPESSTEPDIESDIELECARADSVETVEYEGTGNNIDSSVQFSEIHTTEVTYTLQGDTIKSEATVNNIKQNTKIPDHIQIQDCVPPGNNVQIQDNEQINSNVEIEGNVEIENSISVDIEENGSIHNSEKQMASTLSPYEVVIEEMGSVGITDEQITSMSPAGIVVEEKSSFGIAEKEVGSLSACEVVVGETGSEQPSVKYSLPKHMFTGQPDDSTDSVLDVVGVTDDDIQQGQTASIEQRNFECPVPSPPSTIAYGESDDESMTLNGLEDPDTLDKDPSNAEKLSHPHTVSETDVVDVEFVESSVDIHNSAEVGISSIQLLDAANGRKGGDSLLQSQGNVSHSDLMVGSNSVGQSDEIYGGNKLSGSDIVHGTTLSPQTKALADSSAVQSSRETLISTQESLLLNDRSNIRMESNLHTTNLVPGKEDQTQTVVNTDDIVIDESEGTQVLMENPDGTRFLLNPDGTQIPVYTDELGNNYMMNADGTAVLLQTAGEQSFTDIASHQPTELQNSISDSGVLESYLSTQITQTGINAAEQIEYVSDAAGVVSDGNITTDGLGECVINSAVSDSKVTGQDEYVMNQAVSESDVTGQGEYVVNQAVSDSNVTGQDEYVMNQAISESDVTGQGEYVVNQAVSDSNVMGGQGENVMNQSGQGEYVMNEAVSDSNATGQGEYVVNQAASDSNVTGQGEYVVNQAVSDSAVTGQGEYVVNQAVSDSNVTAGQGEYVVNQAVIDSNVTAGQGEYVVNEAVSDSNVTAGQGEYVVNEAVSDSNVTAGQGEYVVNQAVSDSNVTAGQGEYVVNQAVSDGNVTAGQGEYVVNQAVSDSNVTAGQGEYVVNQAVSDSNITAGQGEYVVNQAVSDSNVMARQYLTDHGLAGVSGEDVQNQFEYVTQTTSGETLQQGLTVWNNTDVPANQVQYVTQADGQTYTVQEVPQSQSVTEGGATAQPQFQYVLQPCAETSQTSQMSTVAGSLDQSGTTSVIQEQFQYFETSGTTQFSSVPLTSAVQDQSGLAMQGSGDMAQMSYIQGSVDQNNPTTVLHDQFHYVNQPTVAETNVLAGVTGVGNTVNSFDTSQGQYVLQAADGGTVVPSENAEIGNLGNGMQVDSVTQSMKETGILPTDVWGAASAGLDSSVGSSSLSNPGKSETYYMVIDGKYHKIDDPQVLASLGISVNKKENPLEAVLPSLPMSQPLSKKQSKVSNLVVQYPSNSNHGKYTSQQHQPLNSSHKTQSLLYPDLKRPKMDQFSPRVTSSEYITNSKQGQTANSLLASQRGAKIAAQNLYLKSQFSNDMSSLYGVGSSNKYQSLKKRGKYAIQNRSVQSHLDSQHKTGVKDQMCSTIQDPKQNVTKYYIPMAQAKQPVGLTMKAQSPINGINQHIYRVKPPTKKSPIINLLKESPKQPAYSVIKTKVSDPVQITSLDKGLQQHKSWTNGLHVKKTDPAKCDVSIQRIKGQTFAVSKNSIKTGAMNSGVLLDKAKKSGDSTAVFYSLKDFVKSTNVGSQLADKPSTVIRLVSKARKDTSEDASDANPTQENMEMTSAELMEVVKQGGVAIPDNATHSFQDMFTANVAKGIPQSHSPELQGKHSEDLKRSLVDQKKKEPNRLTLGAYLKSNLKGPPRIQRRAKGNSLDNKLCVKPMSSPSVSDNVLNVQTVSATPPAKACSDFMCQVNMGTPQDLINDDGKMMSQGNEQAESLAMTVHHDCGTKVDVGAQASKQLSAQVGEEKTLYGRGSLKGGLVKQEPQTPGKVVTSPSKSCVTSPVKYQEGAELFDMECVSVDQDTKEKQKKKEKTITARVTPKKEDSRFHQSTSDDPDWVVAARRKILSEEETSTNADQNGNKIVQKPNGNIVDVTSAKSNVEYVLENPEQSSIVISSVYSLANSVIKTESSGNEEELSDDYCEILDSKARKNTTSDKDLLTDGSQQLNTISRMKALTEKCDETVDKVKSSLGMLHSRSCDQRKEEVVVRMPECKEDPRTSLFEVGVDCKAKHSDSNVYDGIITQVDGSGARCYIDFLDKGCEWCLFADIIPPESEPAPTPPPSMDYVDEKIVCFNCKSGRDATTNQIVICDGCGKGFHQLCHSPVIEASVIQEFEQEWICSICRPITPVFVEVKPLPYDLNALTWNASHTENAEEVYCYCGGHGNWFLQMLQCRKCLQWFHQDCVSCLSWSLLLGDQFYIFLCSVCNRGQEYLYRLHLRWVDVAHLAIFHLGLSLGKRYIELKTEIAPWVHKHWTKMKLTNQAEFDKRRRLLKLEDVLSDVHYVNKFRNGKQAHKTESHWALRVRAPPPTPSVTLPLMHPLTAANTRHYRWKPMYKLSNIDCGTVTWNFAQPQPLNRKRKLSVGSDPGKNNPQKRRKLDAKGSYAGVISLKHALPTNTPEGPLSLLEKKIPELSSYSGLNHPFLLGVERFQMEQRNRNKGVATQRLAAVDLVVEADVSAINAVEKSTKPREMTESDEEEAAASSSRVPYHVLAKRLNSDRLEYLIDWYL